MSIAAGQKVFRGFAVDDTSGSFSHFQLISDRYRNPELDGRHKTKPAGGVCGFLIIQGVSRLSLMPGINPCILNSEILSTGRIAPARQTTPAP